MKPILKSSTYDVLKWVVMIVLPALATLYGTLAKIWGLPYPTEIPATITAITVFLGIVIGISTYQYNQQGKGDFE